MLRYRVAITGGAVVGPGLMTFYSNGAASGFPAAVQAFVFSQAAKFPTSMTFAYTNGGDELDPVTGDLTGVWSTGTAPSGHAGTGTGAFALGVGCQVRWRTNGIVGGRRVVGSTFFVPVVASTFDADGTLLPAAITALNSAAGTLISAVPELVIWSRPRPATETSPARVGTTSNITSGFTPDRPSWLRSRKT